MYNVQQMQGLDYVLKRITKTDEYKYLYKKNLQLVVEIEGRLWRGDFVKVTDGNTTAVVQREIETDGNSETITYNASNNVLLKKSTEKYHTTIPQGGWVINPYKEMQDFHILYKYLSQIISDIEITKETESKLYPYLYDATSLDGIIKLPLLDLSDKEIKLVSIIDVTE